MYNTIQLFIKSLPKKCFFQIIFYGNELINIFDNPQVYSDINIQISLKNINSIINENKMEIDKNRIDIITVLRSIFNTSGCKNIFILIGNQNIENLENIIFYLKTEFPIQSKTRLFPIGIGIESTSINFQIVYNLG